jgi:hypothetical protein
MTLWKDRDLLKLNASLMSQEYPFQRVINRTGCFKMSKVSFEEYQKQHPKDFSGRTFFNHLDANNIRYQVKESCVVLSKKAD